MRFSVWPKSCPLIWGYLLDGSREAVVFGVQSGMVADVTMQTPLY